MRKTKFNISGRPAPSLRVKTLRMINLLDFNWLYIGIYIGYHLTRACITFVAAAAYGDPWLDVRVWRQRQVLPDWGRLHQSAPSRVATILLDADLTPAFPFAKFGKKLSTKVNYKAHREDRNMWLVSKGRASIFLLTWTSIIQLLFDHKWQLTKSKVFGYFSFSVKTGKFSIL